MCSDNLVSFDYTVAICTHNHANKLLDTLQAIETLDEPDSPWELLVIDNASTDGTADAIKAFLLSSRLGSVRVVYESKLGVANARNRAICEAHGQYVIFIDDDETPDRAWLVTMVRAIRQWKPDAIGGRIEVDFRSDNRPKWLSDELLGFLGGLNHGTDECRLKSIDTKIFTGNSAFKKSSVEEIGYFDAELGRRGSRNHGGEDTDMYIRLIRGDYEVIWLPTAVIYHRIEKEKLKRRYFLELHYRQGFQEGRTARGLSSRIPPVYLFGQLYRAFSAVIRQWLKDGIDSTIRKQMNVAYFLGYISGWSFSAK